MNSGRTVFAQLVEFLPVREFRKCVDRYRGEYKVQRFTCLDQFLCMAFAQLTFRESLRDIETCLRAVRGKLYHMGIRGGISRTTLAKANENRDWRIFADFAQVLIRTARDLYANDPFAVELEQTVYALDSTTIDLCLSLFPWAKFRKRKAAVKLHTLLDLRGNIPSFIKITDGKWHDVNVLDELIPEPGSYYVMDRGYLDFERLHAFSDCSAFFVIRAKKNLRYRRLYSAPVDKTTGVRSDQTIVLTGVNTADRYPDKVRRIRFVDAETGKNLIFLSNDFSLPPESIALLYKQRWQVGVSSEGRITQSVHVRPRPTDPKPRSLGGAVARKQDGEALRQHSLKGGCATHQVVTYSERRCSLVTRKPGGRDGLQRAKAARVVENGWDTAILTGGVSAATWSEGLCGNWRSPRCPSEKSRRRGPAYNREWEMAGTASGWRIGS